MGVRVVAMSNIASLPVKFQFSFTRMKASVFVSRGPGGSECIYRDKEPQTGHCLLIAATLEQAQRLGRAVKHLVELVKPEEPKYTDPFAH